MEPRWATNGKRIVGGSVARGVRNANDWEGMDRCRMLGIQMKISKVFPGMSFDMRSKPNNNDQGQFAKYPTVNDEFT